MNSPPSSRWRLDAKSVREKERIFNMRKRAMRVMCSRSEFLLQHPHMATAERRTIEKTFRKWKAQKTAELMEMEEDTLQKTLQVCLEAGNVR